MLFVAVILVGLLAFLPNTYEGHAPGSAAEIPAPTSAADRFISPSSIVLPGAADAPSPEATPTAVSPTPVQAQVLKPSIPPSATPALPSHSPTPSPTSAPTPTPAPTDTPTPKSGGKPLSGLIIGVDPGHQAHSNSELEPNSPGSSDMKKKVSSGTYGRFTGVREHEVVLRVGLHLRDLLEDAGAVVIMTRTKADVDISNVERAKLFNKKNVDLGVRLHCNGSNDESVHGAFMLVPKSHPYKEESVRAAKLILDAYGKETGISIKKGITYRADQTGFNWCERPIVNIEMGHMTNEKEDYKLTDHDFQKKMARGIYNGILLYFED